MARKSNEEVSFSCPVGSFFADMEKIFGKKSKFFSISVRNNSSVSLVFLSNRIRKLFSP